jgi:pyruvate/2-oxoglutarate dehydrogenase complex dihydrolipoamide acyltransferase (E2) component
MRNLFFALAVLGTGFAVQSAPAQAGGNYPFCLQGRTSPPARATAASRPISNAGQPPQAPMRAATPIRTTPIATMSRSISRAAAYSARTTKTKRSVQLHDVTVLERRRRSIRAARSMLCVAISIATRVARTS